MKFTVDLTDDFPDHDSKLPDGSTADFARDGTGHVRIWLGEECELRLTTFQVIDLQTMIEKLTMP